MMSSPAGLQQGQFHFLSQWMPDSSRAGVILNGSPVEAGSGSVRSSGSLVVQDPDDSFSCQFVPLPISRSSSCASMDVCSPGGSGKTLGETELFDASLNSEMQNIQDVLRNTRDLPLIAKLEQLKQMQHRMQEQLKAHQQGQLRLQNEPQRLLGNPRNAAETSMLYQEQSEVELNTGQDDNDPVYEESLQSIIEDQTLYRKECNSEPQDRPIKSGLRTFEEILEEQLKMEDQRLMMGKNAPAESVKVKRPFLKRGEGLIRFTLGKSAAPSHRNSPPKSKPSSCPNPKLSQGPGMKSKRKSIISKTEGSKSTHHVIQRKTAVLNKENFPQNKTTAAVTKMTVQPHVLVAHQGQNMGSISAQFQRKPDPLSKQKIYSVTKTNDNRERACNRVEDKACIGENSFEVWFTERGEHWEQDNQRECAELGEFELLERVADEISFSSNSSFINNLLQRDHRRLSSTPIKSTHQSTQGPTVAPGTTLGYSVPAPPTNTAIQRDVVGKGPNEVMRGLSEKKTDEKLDDNSLCCNSELQPLPNMSNPPISHCFQVPTTLPYDKSSYQDRDGASSPEEDERNSSNNRDSTLVESRAQLEFDDDDTWNEPEEESCCPAEESLSERTLKRKVAFSKGVKAVDGSPHAVGNQKEAPPTCQLVSKFFPVLKAKPSPPVAVQEPQNMPSEEGAAQSRLLRERLVELETEIERFKSENAALAKLKQENQETRDNLKKDRLEFEKKRMEENAKWEEFKREENKKLQREKKLFEKHAATVRARPDKQERDEIQALKQQLNMLQEDLRKREARWSNTQSRLRQQVDALSAENTSLRDQVRTLEKLRLSVWKSAEKEKEKGRLSASSNRTSTGSKCTDSRSPSLSSQSNSSRKGSPEIQIPLTDSAFFPEQMKEGIILKREHSPVGTHTAVIGQSEEEQEEITQSDNKIEKVLPDGGRLVVFPNGTRKELSANGQTVKVMFFNGDVKHAMPDKRVIYYYAEAQTTHITYPDGMEVLQFPNNQTEKHFPDGRKEITFPDQTVKTLYPDGREESVLTDGTIIQLNPDGSKVIQFNTGQREIHTTDFKRREYPDGTVKTVYSDGRQETQYPTGRVRLKDAQGHVIMDTKA
ncbi:centromere protein J [Pseudorasbora parva]|uniref:centromere protein J n=1 Tax=Pseudorasbora parva TaxID=51549 RepID=UPI00351F7EB4